MKVFDIDPYCSNYPPEMYDRTKVIPFKLDNSDVAFYTYIGMASRGSLCVLGGADLIQAFVVFPSYRCWRLNHL